MKYENMNLQITIQDLRLGRYESQKNILFHKLVKQRAILNDPNDDKDPPKFIRSELLELMLKSCDSTGVIVVHEDRSVGKSAAAKFVLRNASGGIMFCNCKSTGTQFYWKGVAQALGIPVDVYENDSTSETLLVKAVAAAKQPDEVMARTTWTERLFDGLLSMCNGTKLHGFPCK
jgi:hypothetical protein